MESFIPIFRSSLIIMIPILFAAAGGLFPALAGNLNIALEGLLITSAFTSIAVYHYNASAVASIAAAVFVSMLLSALHAFGSFKLRANVFISGLAVNLFSGGLCAVLSGKIFNTRGVVALSSIHTAKLPAAQGLLTWYLLFGLLFLLAAWFVIYKTPFGYRLRACEKNTDALLSLGINTQNYRTAAFLISGFFAGIGGSFLSLNLGAFVPGMSSGRGWIALVVIFLGSRKLQGILAASFIFALAEAFSNYAQGFLAIPSDFILAFPYVVTLIVMIAVSIRPISKKVL